MYHTSIPICTRSPTCRSDIVTDFPFSRFTLAEEGKQPPPESDEELDSQVQQRYSVYVIWPGQTPHGQLQGQQPAKSGMFALHTQSGQL